MFRAEFQNNQKGALPPSFKIAIIIVITFVIIFSAFNLKQCQFGYFIKGPIMQHTHNKSDIITLNNGDILILGTNEYKVSKNSKLPKLVKQIPFEIYSLNENKFIDYKLPIDLAYLPKGLLLNNNQLLLTFASDLKTTNISYSSMAIINLQTKKIEKIIPKKINKQFEPNYENTNFTLLNNGEILIIDFKNQISEIYNPQTNISKILDIKFDKQYVSKVIAQGKNKALIFDNYGNVQEFDASTKKLKVVGKYSGRENSILERINSNEILLLGGNEYPFSFTVPHGNGQEIEIYNTETNTSKVICKLQKKRNYNYRNKISSFAVTPINNRYYLISGGQSNSTVWSIQLKSTEILDLKNNKIIKGPNMKSPHFNHKMVPLKNGDILIFDNQYDYHFSQSTEIFKVRKGTAL